MSTLSNAYLSKHKKSHPDFLSKLFLFPWVLSPEEAARPSRLSGQKEAGTVSRSDVQVQSCRHQLLWPRSLQPGQWIQDMPARLPWSSLCCQNYQGGWSRKQRMIGTRIKKMLIYQEDYRFVSSSFVWTQVNDSVHITWEAPSTPSGRILEYSMYMAVKKSRSTSSERTGQMAFIRIYRGTKMSCSVSSTHMDNAHIDCSASNRPAVVFRIAAKNEQGYGPATQIRWIQGDMMKWYSDQTAWILCAFLISTVSVCSDPSKVRAATKADSKADAEQDAADR